jgi:hemoglobin-like flavoprotein
MDIRESLDFVLSQKELFGKQFYALFLGRHPELRPHFAGVNMLHQELMLTMALTAVARHHRSASPATEMYLQYLGTQHHDRGVTPESYPKFRAAFLETLERVHGAQWDPDLASQWGEAIDCTTATMLEGYRQRFHV